MEKNIIFCFTGTGNSLKVSEDIANSLEDCTISPVTKKGMGKKISGYRRVGVVFPVYFLGMPQMVVDFLQELEIADGKRCYFYLVATCGRFPGNAARQGKRLLADKGIQMHYANHIIMGDNAVAYYTPKVDLDNLESGYKLKIKSITEEIRTCEKSKIGKVITPVYTYYQMQISKVEARGRYYRAGPNCTGCGLCSRVCPAENISMTGKQPRFQNKCQQCMACIQLCPQQAICYKGKGRDRPRYRHPDVSVKQIAAFNSGSGQF